MRFFSRFFDSNDREVSRLQPLIDQANALEPEYEALSDAEIRERVDAIRADIVEVVRGVDEGNEDLAGTDPERRRDIEKERNKKSQAVIQAALDEVIPEVFAAGREAMKRTMGMRQYDVQLMGAIVLHQGKIAEMRTGEGKTFIPTLAAVLNGMTGRGAHIVTVNDYLARRDAQWMGPAYHYLGMSVGVITHDTSYVYEPGYPTTDERLMNLRPCSRREAYAADITYGTNNEFGFDYLRDNMVDTLEERVQRERSFAIVDEVDNILIDEARTPLIISGQAEESADLYFTFARLVPRLKERPEGAEEGGDYFVDLKDKAVSPTEEGIDRIEQMLSIPNLYDADPRLARHFDSALKAHALYKRDRDYIVENGEIIIVDEFTGRKMPGRRWSEGLHQAVEAKEGLRVQRESRTLATITFQNYFRLYDKLAGMTGTAMTEAEEFHKIYNLEVVGIPTHRPMIREDMPDLVYKSEAGKFNALIDEIEEMVNAGRPVLVGTISVEKSEVLGTLLKRRGVSHEVLNAKFHEREAGIIAQAGRAGAVTIATNMAGRGTDIQLGGNTAGLASEILHRQGLNPAEVDKATYDAAFAEAKTITEAGHEDVVKAGGLHIIGTERHDSRRIDNQLRGRAGRQGDPGSSRFYLSLDDDLMKRFASDRVAGLMDRLGLDDDVPIESRIVSRTIESAQTRVEGFNFDIRKRVVEFDDVINRQRETIYAERDKVLRNEDLTETVQEFLDAEVEAMADTYLESMSPSEWNLEGFATALKVMGIEDPGATLAGLDEAASSREALVGHVRDLVDAALATRAAENGEEVWAQVERFVLLRTIDSLWVEHLTEIDDMRRGIGLRGYAQQDPLNEFRREAFRLYEELRGLIRRQVATTIFRVTVHKEPATVPLPGPGQPVAGTTIGEGAGGTSTSASATLTQTTTRQPLSGGQAALRQPGVGALAGAPGGVASGAKSLADAVRGLPSDPMKGAREAQGSSNAGPAGGPNRPGFTPAGARIGRNDPCWCGSGQKYKKCHGA